MKSPSRIFLLFVTLCLSGGGGALLRGAEFTSGPRIGPEGHYYEVVFDSDQVFKWEQARIAALNRDPGLGVSHLATIGSEREDVFIEKLRQEVLVQAGIDAHGADPPPFWVGGYQLGNPGSVGAQWYWLDDEGESWGERLDDGYSNWNRGEPNDWPSAAEDQQEDYLVIGHAGRFGWNDAGAQMNGYVVEYEVESDPVAVGRWGADNRFYEVVIDTHDRTWEEAVEEARWSTRSYRRGSLAALSSIEEVELVEELRKDAIELAGYDLGDPDSHPELWLGGWQEPGQAGVATGWQWLNGEGEIGANGFSNWWPGEPNDWPDSGVENDQENHLVVGFRGREEWNDSSGAHPGYVVEYVPHAPPQRVMRSSRYAGDGGIRLGFSSPLPERVRMTIEGWIYREESSRTETILASQSFTTFLRRWTFGFQGENLKFWRDGKPAAYSVGTVPSGQWTHVAVSYDGGTARFYINGEESGASAVENSADAMVFGLNLGYVETGEDRAYFLGAMDEMRFWSVVRSGEEIRDGRFSEVRGVTGLEAAWVDGGYREEVERGTSQVYPDYRQQPKTQRTGILPNRLVVPLAVVPPTFDGNVDRTSEYAGAEEMVLRYDDGPSFKDGVVRLVHTGEYLYVGIEGARLPASGEFSPNNVIEVFLDSAGESLGFDGELVRGQMFMEDSLAAFGEVGGSVIVNPITGAHKVFYQWRAGSPTSLEFAGHQGTEREGELTTVRDIEFRFHRSVLGEFDHKAVDRLAVRHADHGGPNGDVWGPEGGDADSPDSWAEVRYLNYPGTRLPRVSQTGRVVDPETGLGVPGVEVSLAGNVVYATTTTSSLGRYQFGGVEVGVGEGQLRVSIVPPEDAALADVEVGEDYDQPIQRGLSEVVFAGCSGNECRLASLTFSVAVPPGVVDVSGFSPETTWPPVLLRKGRPTEPPKVTSTPVIRVDLSNAHEQLDFYLVMGHCPNDPRASSLCEEGVDYFRLDAVRVFPEDGGAPYFELTIPYDYYDVSVPEVPYPRGYRIAAHDRWARDGNDPASPTSWRYAPGMIGVTAPPYPLVHGFAFENTADGHDLDDYRAAFYDQACNPATMVGFWAYAPIYLDVLGGGECVGMVVTANRFARGAGYTSPGSSMYATHGDVVRGNGFRVSGVQDPVLPAHFDTANPCSPAPQNIWAQIRANHGVQMSSELIGKLLEHFELGEHGLVIDLAHQLNRLRSEPLRYQVCFKNGEKGHCVQPLRVIDEVRDELGAVIPNRRAIEIWDPNKPGQTTTIEIYLNESEPDEYRYDGFSDEWSGNWLFVYDVEEIWGGERHVPSVDTLGVALTELGATGLTGLLQLVVSGDAEVMVGSSEGQVGWNAAGDFIETGTGTIGIPSFNWNPKYDPPLGHLPMTMYHRMDAGLPQVRVYNRGEAYKLHASHGGSMLQLFVEGGQDGESDAVQLSQTGELVDGVSLTAGAGGRMVESRVALCRDGSSYPAAIQFGGVSVPGGKSVGVRMLGSGGVEFLNDTGAIVAPDFSILRPGLKGGALRGSQVPNLRIPAGAALRIESPDGTTFENLLFGIDLTRDGTVDEAYLFRSARVGLEQVIGGVPVGFEIEHGEQELKVRWLDRPGWRLVTSRDFEQWDVAGEVVVVEGMAEWVGQGAPGGVFFRLEEVSE